MANRKAETQTTESTESNWSDHGANIGALVLKQSSIQSIHDNAAKQARKVGDELITSAYERIGRGVDDHVKEVEALFKQLAGPRPEMPKELEIALQQPANVPRVAPLAETHHKAVAAARHTYDEARVEGEGKISSARAAWSLALDVYDAAARNAEVILKAIVDEAMEELDESMPDFPAPSAKQFLHFQMGAKVAAGLEVYQNAMTTAFDDLAKAKGALLEGLAQGWTSVADAEATFIKETQTAWEAFWQEAQSALKTPDK